MGDYAFAANKAVRKTGPTFSYIIINMQSYVANAYYEVRRFESHAS